MAGQIKRAQCPSCRKRGLFRESGQQRWPQAVADLHGLPTVITLWTCANCGTTLSECDLVEQDTHTVVV